MTKIINPNPKINEEQLTNFEKQIGVRLPEDYREFMLLNNGGEPDKIEFTVKKYGGSIIQRFFGLGSTLYDTDNFDYILRTFKNRVPPDFLPIASDMLGNLVLIGIKQKYEGKISLFITVPLYRC